MANYLDGKYVLYSESDGESESYQTGQVKATTDIGAFIQFDRMGRGSAKDDWSWPIEFVPFAEFATRDDAGFRAWGTAATAPRAAQAARPRRPPGKRSSYLTSA